MGPDEIRAEIELRKKLARELGLPQMLWELYRVLLEKDPELMCPELQGTLEIADTPLSRLVSFPSGQDTYKFVYSEGRTEKRDSWRSRADDEESITPAWLLLKRNGEPVFRFEIRTREIFDPQWGPHYRYNMGEITAFIQGQWTSDFPELLRKIKAHQKEVRDRRDAPKLREEMKRFGL